MPGLRSQQGQVIALVNKADQDTVMKGNANYLRKMRHEQRTDHCVRFNIPKWKSTRTKRVVKSTFASETLAMVDGIDEGLAIRGFLDELLFASNPNDKPSHVTTCFCDAMSLVANTTVTCPRQTEKRLTVDLLSVREQVENGFIQVRWIPTDTQLADALTKWDQKLAGELCSTMNLGEFVLPTFDKE